MSGATGGAAGVPVLELRCVTKVYRSRVALMRTVDVPAVVDVSFSVESGRTTAILGETGSGKSTLGRLLLGLIEPTSGAVLFRGRDIAGLDRDGRREYRRAVQLVFQSPIASFNPMLTVGSSIRDALRYAPGEAAGGARAETARLLDQVGLSGSFLDRYPDEVSGGELQRAAIARALATRPDVVFLDEPASALDVSIRGQVFNLLMDLQRERGLAYVMVTHELSSARALADRVVVMYLGRVVEVAPARSFFASPDHPYAAALLAAAAIDEGAASRMSVSGDPPSPVDPPSGCPFHPRCWLYRALGEPERCRIELPPLEPADPAGAAEGHASACHFRAWRSDPRVGAEGMATRAPAMSATSSQSSTTVKEDP